MRLTIAGILFFYCCNILSAQIVFERRIIIEDNNFYGVVIDNQTQLAKLYYGAIDQPIDSATVYAVPAGTKRKSGHEIPFAWDILNDTLYCINYTEYAQNSHYNSLKSIPIAALNVFDHREKPTERLLQAAYANHKIINMPMVNTYRQYTYMDDLYFDLRVSAGIVYEFIYVQNQMTVWAFIDNSWQQSVSMPFHTNSYFTVFKPDTNFNIISSTGDQLLYPAKTEIAAPAIDIKEKLVVEDRDSGKNYFIDDASFSDEHITIKNIISNTK